MKRLLFLTFILFTACLPPTDEELQLALPPLTTKGKNTIGAKVNGDIRVNTSWLLRRAEITGDSSLYIKFGTRLGAYENQEVDVHLYLRIENLPIREGETYYVSSNDSVQFVQFQYAENKPNRLHLATIDFRSIYDGKIEINYLNTYRKIVSGTFEFNLMKPSYGEVAVTEGRFDLEYRQK